MAARMSVLVGCTLVVAAMLHCIEAQTTHVVGDRMGWIVPPGGSAAYSTWASNQTFMVGDILVFNFVNGTNDVAKVTKAAFENCNTTSTIGAIIKISPARITLDSEGEHYFISTYSRECSLGQKLAIKVSAGSANPPSTTPSPVPSAPTPVPPPTTHVVGDKMGWLVPPAGSLAYDTWASTQTFRVGDTLLFNFVNGSQDVAEVTKAAYKDCNTTSTIGPVLKTSPARIILESQGEHYYTSTLDTRCSLGQKLAINVTGTATPPSSTPTPTPPPSSTASSISMAGFSVAFLYVVVALF